jgi:Flp pilus assembly protein TadD
MEVGLQHLTEAAALAPDNGEAMLLLARGLIQVGRTSDALPVLRRAAELLPLGIWLANMQLNLARRIAQMGLPARSNAA